MKAHLLYPDRDFDVDVDLPADTDALIQDLGLDTLFAVMGGDDAFLVDIARRVVLTSLTDVDDIRYRQDVLHDCLAHPDLLTQMYALAVEAIDGERHVWRTLFGRTSEMLLSRSVGVLELFVDVLKRLRRISDEHAAEFHSTGFSSLFAMLSRELDDEYFTVVDEHLRQLRFNHGVLLSAQLGTGNKGIRYTLRKPNPPEGSWLKRATGGGGKPSLTLRIPDRDEAGFNALAELRGRGLNLAANALAQSTDHILDFFSMLRRELGFYVSCVRLNEMLHANDEPVCFPDPQPLDQRALSASGLYDVSLALRTETPVVGNDLATTGTSLVMITGANQGGKSTFLRSVGLAQLMMQAGMFTPATSFSGNVYRHVFTHYKREEDASMVSGKLDEELARMSELAERLTPDCLVLFNESFAATNEREGSEIARQIIRALTEQRVTVVFVTHLYDLASSLFAQHSTANVFLRAEREPDGVRTFRLIEGEPLPTSYGPDLYERIFGTVAA